MPLQPAVLGTARLNNFRLNYLPAALVPIRKTRIGIWINGAWADCAVRRQGFSIHDALNDDPNTCSLTVDGTAPVVGQSLRITINSDAPRLLFNGTFQTVALTYEGLPGQTAWACSAIDDIARLNRRIPFGTWTLTSATQIAQSLIASYAPGFNAAAVQAGLAAISINLDGSEGFSSALRQIVQLIGGYYYVEDLGLHLFLTEMTDTPDPLAPYSFLNTPPIASSTDLSQLRTRVYGKGHGEATVIDAAIGETILPLVNSVMFNPAGGLAIVLTDVIGYTGIQLGKPGTVVGPSAAPLVAPYLTPVAGSVNSGVHQYAYVFVTGSGKSLPSPPATITTDTTALAPPTGAPAVIDNPPATGGMNAGQVYKWLLTLATDSTHETTAGPASSGLTATVYAGLLLLSTPSMAGIPPGTIVKIYRTLGNGSTYYLETSTTAGNFQNNHSSGFLVGTMSDAVLSAQPNPPGANTANYGGASVSGIGLGPAGTTAREVYRTAAGAAQLKLLTTIANNTSTGPYVDILADASLGANAPTSDTSGLTTSTGKVNAGSTSIETANAGGFSASGGWVQNGVQFIRYAGVTGNTLTGIPPSGTGAIINTMAYGEHLDPVPALTGVVSIDYPIPKGTVVNIWTQRDDLPAQAAQKLLDGGDGIYEYYVSDERRGLDSLNALCDAHLEMYSRPIVTVTYATRDVKTKSGKTIVVNLTTPPINQTLTIQDVTITEIDAAPGTPPKFTVMASTVRQSLESILRRMTALLD
jgi:hypothetical protein